MKPDPLAHALDDLLPAAELARIRAKARPLDDLLPPPPTPTFGPALAVTILIQETICGFCGEHHQLPLGTLVKHELRRGTRSIGFVSIPLDFPGEHPQLERQREFTHSTIDQCHLCCDRARWSTRPTFVALPAESPPKPHSVRWLEQFGFARTEDIFEVDHRAQMKAAAARKLDEFADLGLVIHKDEPLEDVE